MIFLCGLIVGVALSIIVGIMVDNCGRSKAENDCTGSGEKNTIEEIRSDIEKQIERDFKYAETERVKVPCHYGIANGLQCALRIIDNHTKELGGE